MPEMHFRVRWPDNTELRCYSPSLVIRDYFAPGQTVPLSAFMLQVSEALNIASERVRAKYGFVCSSALGQLHQLEDYADRFDGRADAQVHIIEFEE
jgi:uncharacterized repeat protein (TIGR04042 family)